MPAPPPDVQNSSISWPRIRPGTAERHGISLQNIQPGKLQQNAYVERYNHSVRLEWLGQYIFETIADVQNYATDWLWTYNNDRPNKDIGGITSPQKLKLEA